MTFGESILGALPLAIAVAIVLISILRFKNGGFPLFLFDALILLGGLYLMKLLTPLSSPKPNSMANLHGSGVIDRLLLGLASLFVDNYAHYGLLPIALAIVIGGAAGFLIGKK